MFKRKHTAEELEQAKIQVLRDLLESETIITRKGQGHGSALKIKIDSTDDESIRKGFELATGRGL